MTVMNASGEKPSPEPCLPGFERVNRYWDPGRKCWVAKILPGEFYVTKAHECVATTLGSCVSACIWDCEQAIGGMNHFMLPKTGALAGDVKWGNALSDATRYGNYAMEHLINEILAQGCSRKNLRAKVCGGGKILNQMNDIGQKNSAFVLRYLDAENIPVLAQDLEDTCPRKVLFEPSTGRAMIKRLPSLHNHTLMDREESYSKSLQKEEIEGDVELF